MTQRPDPASTADAAVDADKYQQMLALADLFDGAGQEMRTRARLGSTVLRDDDVAASAELSKATFAQAEDDIRAATTGKRGLLTRSVELDADALVVRATVLTYRWIDDLQQAVTATLGSIAGRAIGYLAPEVALGGAIVSAGLIETDALDRDDVAGYLNELAQANPDLMEHMAGGGGLLEGLQMRSLLTSGALGGEQAPQAARGGLSAIGVGAFAADAASALRDAAGGHGDDTAPVEPTDDAGAGAGSDDLGAPRSLADLMANLVAADSRVSVQHVGAARYIAYLPGERAGSGGGLRLVNADTASYARQVVKTIEAAVGDAEGARVMLVGGAHGGTTAAEVAASAASARFVIDQVVTVGAPSAHVPAIPEATRVLSLEDRSDPVALLGSLINAGVDNRMTVVFDGGRAAREDLYLVGGRAADDSAHPELLAEIRRIHELGFLAG